MSTPIEKLLDQVEWTELPNGDAVSDLPHATHEGVLAIGPLRLAVAQLSNGRRVITEDGMREFCAWLGIDPPATPGGKP